MKQLKEQATPETDEAWTEALKGVKKLKPCDEPPAKPLIIEQIGEHINYQEAYNGAPLSRLTHGCVDNIDRRLADKFRRGELAIERRIDLHGMTEDTAFNAVSEFIKKAYIDQLRCVLVVTGKGLHQEDDIWFERRGVLRELVPQWLNTNELRPLLLSFCYAQPADGGEGALYVLLRAHHHRTGKLKR